MTVSDTLSPPNGPVLLSRSWDIVLIGMVVYGLLACGLMQSDTVFPYGQNLYDEYYLAILDGHLDLPPRVAQVEGHYTPDGVAYLYHGVAPLLSRFVFGWIWPFETWSLASLSIWIWACLGTLCYHTALMKVAGRDFGKLGDQGVQLSRLLSIAVWFGSPGILLAANTSFYHEPIVLAYALTGGFVLIWSEFAFGSWALRQLALPSALLAAIALHARPNVAIGLYLATVLLLLWLSAKSLRQNWLRVGFALALLGASGLGYLALNSARFGSLTTTHGSFGSSGSQYGFVFWGAEEADSERAEAFKEHGKFNAARIPHNLTIYLLDLPELHRYLDTARKELHAVSARFLAGSLGFIRIEQPYAGLVFLWPLWLLFGTYSVVANRQHWKKLALPVVGTAATTVLTLAYGTITLRYRIDVWPFFALLALLGLSALLPKVVATPRKASLKWGVGACFLIGLLVSAHCVSQLRYFQTGPLIKPSWSRQECEALVNYKKLPLSDLDRLCQPPRIGG
jgi:hypothetical protein